MAQETQATESPAPAPTEVRKFWKYERTGSPEAVLEKGEGPVQDADSLSPTQVLVKVAYTSLNPLDYKVMRIHRIFGKVAMSFPVIPCEDFSGTVLAVGKDVKDLTVGQRVWGVKDVRQLLSTHEGALSTHLVCDSSLTIGLPDTVSLKEAAGLGIAGMTAFQALTEQMHMRRNQRLVVIGGSGGVGTFAIQIARALGCEVTTVSSTRNLTLCHELGATYTIDYTTEDVLDRLNDLAPYDAVFDAVGENYELYKNSYKFLKSDGSYVGIAADFKLSYLSLKLLRDFRPRFLGGSVHKYTDFTLNVQPKLLKEFTDFFTEHHMKTVVDSVHTFDDALGAFQQSMSSRSRGKVIIKISDDA
ncbi:peptidase [Schizosaccharomyces japonicus yFS275]|uniref:Peptidase n=1 Tax=Schizosaccharomyces japonicus (strain yFS275 / FY16936) TaxID=402676 RepID=B6K6N9_SCHJY|nr:peptidase [Schizosaccharomyces japonicus yFS275]EEB09193.1 peptidase [Schizosaccharomyces japonicus yFS275]